MMGSRDYHYMHSKMSESSKKNPHYHPLSQASKGGLSGPDLLQSEQGRFAKYCMENIESAVVVAANEPSLAIYRIQEHVRKSVARLVDRKLISEGINERSRGTIFDTEYAIDATKSIAKSLNTFTAINANLKNAIHLAQQIEHERLRHRPSK